MSSRRIIDATYRVCDDRGGLIDTDSESRQRLRTMTLLMRWSGLRIRDAITLERHRLHGDSLLLYQAKTGTPVYVPLPPFVIEALENVPAGSETQSPLLLLERQRESQKRGRQLADGAIVVCSS